MITKILHFAFVALEVIFIFNLLIVVHEIGHFLAARWRGLVIDEFGVWFGKPIWKKKIGDVWYSLGSIPAGGFVKLPQLAPMEAIEGETEDREVPLPPISPLDKIIVALAGPVFSFLLAIVMAFVVSQIGKPVHEFERELTIGVVVPGGPADKAGLKVGDKIIEVDGHKVTSFFGPLHSVTWHIIRSEGSEINFLVERPGEPKPLLIPSGWEREENPKWKRKGLRKVLISPLRTPVIGNIAANSPAEEAGLQPNDLIVSAQQQPVDSVDTFVEIIIKNGPGSIALEVKRDGKIIPLTLAISLAPEPPSVASSNVPKETPDKPILKDPGISFGRISLVTPSIKEQITDSTLAIRNMLDAQLSPKSDIKLQHFSGPIGIFHAFYRFFTDEHGWRRAIAFAVLLNVNLAIFNMLPLPVLDGGHITLAIIEMLRGKPLQSRFLEYIQTACAIALMGFGLYVSSFDITDFVPWKKPAAQPPPASAPATQPEKTSPPPAATPAPAP